MAEQVETQTPLFRIVMDL